MLRALELSDMEHIRKWRNESLSMLRTPFPLTKEQQEDWYRNEICNRNSRSRFFAIEDGFCHLVGYGGLENIQWENGIAELSLLIDPNKQGCGFGKRAAFDIMERGFGSMRLHTIYAECYANNPAVGFWDKVFLVPDNRIFLPDRKFIDGKFVGAYYYWETE